MAAVPASGGSAVSIPSLGTTYYSIGSPCAVGPTRTMGPRRSMGAPSSACVTPFNAVVGATSPQPGSFNHTSGMGWSKRHSMSSYPSMSGQFSMSASVSIRSTDSGGYTPNPISERVVPAMSCTSSSENEWDDRPNRCISSPSFFIIHSDKEINFSSDIEVGGQRSLASVTEDEPDANAESLPLHDEQPLKEDASITTDASSSSASKANDSSFVGTRRRAILTSPARLSQGACVAKFGVLRPSVNYDEEAIRKGVYRLRVEVLNAFDLARPQYRLGDFASSLVCSGPQCFTGVYVTVGLGKHQKLRTRCAHNPEGMAQVAFPAEKLLFHYHGEAEISVAVFDHRNFNGVFRGDPLIGEGVLPLNVEDLRDGRVHSCSVPLSRRLLGPRLPNSDPSVHGGCVLLRYQLVERPDRSGY